MKRKLFAAFLACTMLLSLIPLMAVSAEPLLTADADVIGTLDGADLTLAGLKQVSSGKVVLTADIVVSEWTPISAFSGTLDGGGHSVTGLNAALFQTLSGTVENLTVTGTVHDTPESSESVKRGLLANTASKGTVVKSCTVNGSLTVIYTTQYVYIGGFFGMAGGVTMTDCVNNSNVSFSSEQTFYGGGLIGNLVGDLTASGCVNTGSVTANTSKTNLIGGLVGMVPNTASTVALENCANYGKVESLQGANGSKCAGLVSVVANAGASVSLRNCLNFGDITGVAMAGGMISDSQGTTALSNCCNFGSIAVTSSSSNAFVGGMAAYLRTGANQLTVCGSVNYGEIAAAKNSGAYAAGMVGVSDDNFDLFENNTNQGTVKSKKYAAGMIGKLNTANAVTLKNCLALCSLEGAANGGMIGHAAKAGTISYELCYALSPIPQVTFYNSGSAKQICNGEENLSKDALNASILKTQDEINSLLVLRNPAVQTSKVSEDAFHVRFLAGLDSLGYSRIGFELIRVEENCAPSAAVEKYSGTVYTSVTGFDADGNETVYTAQEDFGSAYLSAVTVKNVPTDRTVTFLVRPYLVSEDGESRIYGQVSCVTYAGGVLVTE